MIGGDPTALIAARTSLSPLPVFITRMGSSLPTTPVTVALTKPAYAGLVKATVTGLVGSEDPILVLNTGSGLKDVRAAMSAVESAPIIEPTLEAVKRIL